MASCGNLGLALCSEEKGKKPNMQVMLHIQVLAAYLSK